MQVINVKNCTDIKSGIDVAIGYFDGCHLGHQKLLSLLSNKKTVITFDKHIYKKSIFTLEQRIELLEKYGVEYVYVLDMDFFKEFSANDFVKFLNNPSKIVVGYDFKFGKNASGDVKLLKKSFNTIVVEQYQVDGLRVSSTLLKNYFSSGEIKKVNQLLSRNYSVYEYVVSDQKLGATIGFATANMVATNMYLKRGVYKTNTKINDIIYKSITNVGTRPTVGDGSLKIETHIFDFDNDIYGQKIQVEFIDFVRSEMKFNSLEELISQIKVDIGKVKDENGN